MNLKTSPKFTYIIGAGASAYALPLAKDIGHIGGDVSSPFFRATRN